MLVAVTAVVFPFVLMALPLTMELLERRVLRRAGRHRRPPVPREAATGAAAEPSTTAGRGTGPAGPVASPGVGPPVLGDPTRPVVVARSAGQVGGSSPRSARGRTAGWHGSPTPVGRQRTPVRQAGAMSTNRE